MWSRPGHNIMGEGADEQSNLRKQLTNAAKQAQTRSLITLALPASNRDWSQHDKSGQVSCVTYPAAITLCEILRHARACTTTDRRSCNTEY